MASPIQTLLDGAQSYLPHPDLARLERAYEFARDAHEGQTRFSGEPYITHPIAAAELLLQLQPDEDSLVACLLHDVVEDTPRTLEDVRKHFGPVVARLCRGLEKLGKVRYHGEERQIENLRKMFVAMASDLRVIFVKLADRLHNMQTLQSVRPDKQARIAKETLEIYAPIAARLGLYNFKTQLEDLSFRYAYPEEYKRIAEQVTDTTTNRQKVIEAAADRLRNMLREVGIEAEVTGRIKHLYSIWKKMEKKKYDAIDEIYDLFALRVIVRNNADCYAALGIIHNHFKPISHRFKDFIAVPKTNGYQSLHTTVLGLDTSARGYPVEVQIRTRAMHAQAERGAAAHWEYSAAKKSVTVESEKLAWVKNLVDLHDRLKDNREFVETLSTDILRDRIFVLTPKGDVFDLPRGATPIDFAYHVHTDVGNTMIGAKVDGRIVPLSRALRNNEVIEIVRKKGAHPSRDWINLAKTDSARNKIRSYFNVLDKQVNVTAGRDLLNRALARLGQSKLDADLTIFKHFRGKDLPMKDRESLVERVGNGSFSALSLAKEAHGLNEPEHAHKPGTQPEAAKPKGKPGEIVIAGETGLPYSLAKCCEPEVGQPIAALMSQKKGAVIHRQDCKMFLRSSLERRLVAYWGGSEAERPRFAMLIEADDRVGLLRDIAGIIAEHNALITDVRVQRYDRRILHERMEVEVESFDQFSAILDSLESMPGIIRVTRTANPA